MADTAVDTKSATEVEFSVPELLAFAMRLHQEHKLDAAEKVTVAFCKPTPATPRQRIIWVSCYASVAREPRGWS